MAAMPNGDWIEIAVKVVAALAGAIVGAVTAVWRLGRNSVKAEHSVERQIAALREEVRTEMAAHVQKSDDGRDLLVAQFKESFEGMRRQHDDHKLDVEKRFMLKDDFKDFRDEYREDMRDIKTAIAGIARTK